MDDKSDSQASDSSGMALRVAIIVMPSVRGSIKAYGLTQGQQLAEFAAGASWNAISAGG